MKPDLHLKRFLTVFASVMLCVFIIDSSAVMAQDRAEFTAEQNLQITKLTQAAPDFVASLNPEELYTVSAYMAGQYFVRDSRTLDLLERLEQQLPANRIDRPVSLLSSPILDEDFSDITFPPTGWTSVNLEGASVQDWSRVTDEFNSSPASAHRVYSPSGAQNDWLISPALVIDSDGYLLEFVDRVAFGSWYNYSGVQVSTGSADPLDGDFVEIFEIDPNPGASWRSNSLNLAAYEGQTIHIAFMYSGEDAHSWWVDDVLVYEPAAEPSTAVLVSPADEAVNLSINPTLSWSAGAGTAPDEFDIYFGTSPTPPLAATVPASETSWDTPELDFETTYYWNIVAKNAAGSADPSATRSFTTLADPTISTLPYFEDFDGTWSGSPAAPTGWTVINADGGVTWTQSNQYISPVQSGTFAAHGMGNQDDWLITPPIDLTDTDARISWYDRVESATRNNSYRVYVSTTTPEIASFTDELTDINVTNTAWTERTLDLSAYNGETIYVAFYQYYSAATNWGFGIDAVSIDEILPEPPNAAVLSFPEDDIKTFLDPELSWAAAEDGQAATGYTLYFDTNNPPTTEVFDGDELSYQTESLTHNTTYYWYVVASNAFGDADPSPIWSFTTVGESDLAEGFESATFPPVGWANPGTWSRSTFSVFEGSGSASKFVSTASDSDNPFRLRTPVLTPDLSSTLEFAARSAAFNPNLRLQVQYSSDGDTWTNIGTVIELAQQGDWELYSVDISSLTGDDYFFSFSVYSEGSSSGTVYLDYVRGPEVTPLAPNAVTLTGPADEATDVSRTPDLSWTPDGDGGIPDGFRVYLDTNPAPTTEIADVAESPHTVSPALDYGETYYWKVVAYNAEGDAPDSDVRSFTTMSDPTITDFPYSERFPVLPGDGGTSILPELPGWSASGGTWNQRWINETRIAGTGWVETTTVGAQLFTPPFDIPVSSDFQLSFWHRTEGGTQEQDIDVYLSNDGGNNYDVLILELEDYTNTTYTQHTFDLSAYAGETIQLRFRKTGGNTTWGWGFDDLFIGPAESATLAGQEGFFLISNPLEQNQIGNLLSPFWTQGFPGADSPDVGDPNVFTYNEASDEYTVVTSANSFVSAGSALAVYVYDDDHYDGVPNGFPKDIVSVGPNWSGDVAAPVSNDGSGWNLIGNPYPYFIDLDLATELDHYENLTGFFYRYNNPESRWEVFDSEQHGITDTFSGEIAPFEGFLVEASGADPEFTFKEDLESVTPANVDGDDEAPGFIRLMSETNHHSAFTNIVFLEEHTPGREGARFLYPLTDEMTTLFSVHEQDAYMMRYIDREFSGEVTIPVSYYTTDEGTMKLSWDIAENIPADWTLELLDTHTGERMDITLVETYEFEIGAMMESFANGSGEGDDRVAEIAGKLQNPAVTASEDARFALIVGMTSTDLDPDGELPKVFALNQNYPNPFNPTTQINYDLPEAVDVRLDVYNIQGQRVATLVNAAQSPGSYHVTFDANRLASGVYLYRLQAGSYVMTKKMTLIK